MDTKLKSINYSLFLKTIAFLIIAIALTTATVQVQYLAFSGINIETILVDDYSESSAFLEGDVTEALYEMTRAINGEPVQSLGDGYYYYYTDGKEISTNLASADVKFFDIYKGNVYRLSNGQWINQNDDPNFSHNIYYYDTVDPEYTGYMAFTTEYLNAAQYKWQNQRYESIPLAISLVGIVIGTLLLLLYLTITIGRTSKNAPLELSSLDAIPSDLFFLIYLGFGKLWVIGMSEILGYTSFIASRRVASMIIVGLITFGFIVITGFVYLSFVRRIKAKQLLKNSLIYKFFFGIFDYFRSIFDGRMFKNNKLTQQLFYRQATFIGISAFLVFLTFLFIFVFPLMFIPPIAELFVIFWYVQGNRKTFEAIDQGFNESLEDQMKAERMKIQLVTNVSHDLKTPLTSIISYADLLSKEACLDETSRDYVNILMDKSNRLKNIVADLFDLAKSTSGDIQLELEAIDLKKLIEQTLADMGDEIEKSSLQFKVKLPAQPVTVMADGKKMYRVFQNLIDNALKYGLQGTRVFIDLEKVDQSAFVSIKNTSGYEMDFTAEEILQRFSRGDTARSTDGSGLGLSIAESFTQVCGGKFQLNVDGDLFKVTLQFTVIKENQIKPLEIV